MIHLTDLTSRAKELVPDSLRGPFEKTFLEPLRRQERAQQIAVQLAIPKEIAAIQQEIDALVPQEETAALKISEFESDVSAAQAKLQATLSAKHDLHWRIFELRGQIEILRSRQALHCSALIVEFIREMHGRWDDLRRAVKVEERPGLKARFSGKVGPSIIKSNTAAVNAAVEYIRDAMREAERLKSQPATDDEISRRLDQLRAQIPDHQQFTEVERGVEWLKDESPRYSDGHNSVVS